MAGAKDIRIVYMGTPDFAVEPLRLLLQNGYNIIATVTAPDKPAGRGQKINQSAVKRFALENDLPVLQPDKLRDPDFVTNLKSLNADVFIVVAFRMLPEAVWSLPRLGTFNLHASLLPNYRGAAPINWAIINGESKTGVTTFLIDKEIDTGKILLQQEAGIGVDETAGELHDRLMFVGAKLVERTIEVLASERAEPILQEKLVTQGSAIKPAPKLFKETTRIDWTKPTATTHNLIRGLSPYPTAWSELRRYEEPSLGAKIFKSRIIKEKTHGVDLGKIISDEKSYLHVACSDGTISIEEIQVAGKRRLTVSEFLLGFRDIKQYRFE